MNTHTSREEQALNDLLSNEHMPEGLAQATMARIRAAREAEARPVECTATAPENSGAVAQVPNTPMEEVLQAELADADVCACAKQLAAENPFLASDRFEREAHKTFNGNEGVDFSTSGQLAYEVEVNATIPQRGHSLGSEPSSSSISQGLRLLDGELASSPVRTTPARKTPARPTRRHFVQLMAACLAVGCAGAATFAFAHETVQVGLGEAARVQLGLNRWGTVVRVSCADANLQQAVQDLSLFGLPYEDALARLMEDEAVLSELSGPEGLLVVVESPNQSQEQGVLGGCRRVVEGASCKAMCRSARQGTGAGMGGGQGQGHGAGAGNGRGQGSGRGNGSPGSGGRIGRES